MSSRDGDSPGNSNGNNDDSRQIPANEGDSRSETSGATHSGVSLFERLMDTVLGLQHRNNDGGSTNRNASGSSLETATLLSLTQPGNENARAAPANGVLEWTFPPNIENVGATNMQFTTTNSDNQATGTENSNSNSNSDATSISGVSLPEGSDADSRGIVITVNYVFSDENDPLHPNRSGSLVMSLPNNSSNRDPEFIQQLIRFATQMAYSSIVNGLQREKRLTQENFNSLPVVDYDKLGESKACSICFEDMEDHMNLEKDDDERHFKKRKMNDKSASPSPYSSQQPSAASTPPPTAEESAKRPLAEYTGTYDHIPIELPCHHIFGQSCLREWLKDHITCPLCRKPVIEPTEDNNVSPNRNLTILTLPNTLNTDNEADATTGTTTSRLRRILRPASMNPDERNPTTENAISHILGYLRRQRNDAPSNDPLFPSGVSSRRTDNGVDTTLISSNSSNVELNNARNSRDENTTRGAETNQPLQTSSENTTANNQALGPSSEHSSTNNQSNDENRTSNEN
jgi:hypothetical protein